MTGLIWPLVTMAMAGVWFIIQGRNEAVTYEALGVFMVGLAATVFVLVLAFG